MWEELKAYHQLDKKDIPKTFKTFGKIVADGLSSYGFSATGTTSTVKIFKEINNLEFSIFLLRQKGGYNFDVKTSIKPVHFIHSHKFTMTNIKPLGEILDNHRCNSFPLTKEYDMLAEYLIKNIKTKVQNYFDQYDTWQKIMKNRKRIEPKDFGLDNKYDLLIYASIWMKERRKLIKYIDKKLEQPARSITQSEYLKASIEEVNEIEFYAEIKELAKKSDFIKIQGIITN